MDMQVSLNDLSEVELAIHSDVSKLDTKLRRTSQCDPTFYTFA